MLSGEDCNALMRIGYEELLRMAKLTACYFDMTFHHYSIMVRTKSNHLEMLRYTCYYKYSRGLKINTNKNVLKPKCTSSTSILMAF